VAQLCLHRNELEALRARVALISFGTAEQARLWQDETGAPFPFLRDPERLAYRLYGLEASLVRSWQPKVWLRYAQLMLRGAKWHGIQGDSGQLGGDFIVDPAGRLRFTHSSRDPTDRPSVEKLLAALR
jgi:hypothetical protein